MKILAWIIVLALVIWGIFALVNKGGDEAVPANTEDAAMVEETTEGTDAMTDEAAEGADAATTEGEAMTQ